MNISRRALLLRASGVAAVGSLAALAPREAASARLGGASAAGTEVPLRVALAAASSPTLPSTSRDSVFTRSGPGPQYWTPYSWNYTNNAALPESVWQQNISWVAENLAPYGYTMCCTDGWVDYTQTTNANGYITSYSDSWTNDWSYYATYLGGLGMKLGVYYNPMWVAASAVNDTSITVVGTDIPVANIVNSGDYLNSDGEIYWVNVAAAGAKEYVQGYVDYFKNLGVAFLRTDFWAWYESGFDQNVGTVGVDHGSADYATALSWVAEAAGDAIEISVVMPNLFNDAANEMLYGDTVRIDADMTTGGWAWLSAGRQTWQDDWSQWQNPFLGFTGWAHLSGRGGLILDGDFLALSSFSSTAEQQTAINLFTIAGSQLAITDRVDTIGGDLGLWQNSAVLGVRGQGLVGKPYFYNGDSYSSDSGARDSERWAGQLPDGTWVVALFNRNDTSTVTKTIAFAGDLGVSGSATVYDLWTCATTTGQTQISTALAPHASQLVHVVPAAGSATTYQAAFANWGGGANFNNNHAGYTAMGFVDQLQAANAGASVTFAVDAPTAGSYPITYQYANGSGATSTMTVGVGDEPGNVVTVPFTVDFPSLDTAWTTWGSVSGTVTLTGGTNLITVARTSGDTGAINLNSITVANVPAAPSISAVSPSSAAAGTKVTLTGSHFGAKQGGRYLTFSDNGINWGGPVDVALFTVDSWSDTSITFTVPEPSGTGGVWAVASGTTAAVTVTTRGGTSNSVNLAIS
ncbi:carbohydrate-binding protein [Actinospica durhamensis]|uniref:Carbohydrate-binding protein n=1 Tax=Actinospica durhamensis TaxID=1508375 RepID=A0A941ENF2_9ACTN|nr:carbohydrate-binding protein [Actinospica durhamensis]MBR7834280.1 carbohydrate-binding protein [Actinospica durhamensis]